ncbi:type II toxin-antitoxin system ParD family antitoxin [Pseudomonas sp. MWU12-2323]|uniref:type II toxin-antitoxin system ParD family antitoxin n=1 Tax=Pseudomonas sp. MWU12-2323 TaxID=2651296 RepID=UPI00128DFE4C|nr:type II toxin-antitoxin system ParD family antitoxin [Pseudomonas sp. MWU12-2323]MPQ71610.1 type II toxin-antitoxin system ParD family antitoxin [Pseudomonas sp. MWU12-2323]
MATRNVVLTDHMDQIINDLVVSSRYQNASEVMHEGLRLLEQREAEELTKLDALRHATSSGLMDLERGHVIEIGGDQLGELLADIGERATLPPPKTAEHGEVPSLSYGPQ